MPAGAESQFWRRSKKREDRYVIRLHIDYAHVFLVIKKISRSFHQSRRTKEVALTDSNGDGGRQLVVVFARLGEGKQRRRPERAGTRSGGRARPGPGLQVLLEELPELRQLLPVSDGVALETVCREVGVHLLVDEGGGVGRGRRAAVLLVLGLHVGQLHHRRGRGVQLFPLHLPRAAAGATAEVGFALQYLPLVGIQVAVLDVLQV